MSEWTKPTRSRYPGGEGGYRKVVFLLLGLVAVCGWIYIILYSPLFLIRRIEVDGVVSLDEAEVGREVYALLDARSWRPWPERHVWFVDEHALEKQLQNRLFAESIVVDKSYLGVLRLLVKERANKFIFHSHQQYLWVDLNGKVLAELTSDERRQVQSLLLGQRQRVSGEPLIVHMDVEDLLTAGFSVSDEVQVKAWVKTSMEFDKYDLWFREYEPPRQSTSTRARFISAEGFPVIVDTSGDLQMQIRAFKAFIQSKPKSMKISEYVDVRVPGRVYVK